MNVYFLIMFLTLLITWIKNPRTNKEYLWRTILSFVPFFIYAAIRVNFGPDYSSYEPFYERIHDTLISNYDTKKEHIEIGYAFLNMCIPSWRMLLVLDSLLVAAAYVFLIYKYVPSNYAWLAILLLFFSGNNTIFFDLVAIRNGIVACVLVLSLPLIEHRRFLWFALITIGCWTIHSSAIFFLPIAYFVGRPSEITQKEITIWGIVVAFFTILSASGIVERLMPVIAMVGNNSYEEMMQEISANNERGIMAAIFSITLIGLILWGLYSRRQNFNASENMIIRLSLLFAISYLLGSFNTRVSQYFALCFIPSICILVKKYRQTIYSFVLLGMVIIYSFYSFYYVWVLNNPYFVYDTYYSIYD